MSGKIAGLRDEWTEWAGVGLAGLLVDEGEVADAISVYKRVLSESHTHSDNITSASAQKFVSLVATHQAR